MAPTRFGNKNFVTNRSQGFVTNRSQGFVTNRSQGFVTNRSQGFVTNRSQGFVTNRSQGFVTNRSQGFVTNRSPRFLNNRSPRFLTNRTSGIITNRSPGLFTNRLRGNLGNATSRNITDARQVLQKRKSGPRITDLSQKLRSRTGNVGRFSQQRGGVIKQMYSARMNNNNSPVNRLGRLQTNSALRSRAAFGQKYVVPNLARNTVLDRSKFIKVHRGGITVTAKQNIQQRKQRLPIGDELEDMTLSDLPDAEGLVFTRAPSQSLEDRLQQIMPRESSDSSTTVLISNLKHSVTEEDIKELFGVVGQMTSAQLLHPGAALVSYARKEDAITAVENYDKITLDGVAMHCTILSLDKQKKTKPSISSRLGERTSGNLSASFLSPASSAHDRGFSVWSTGRQMQTNAPARNQFLPRNRNPKFTVCLN